MSISATAAENLRGNRIALGVSQSKLARLSGVSRFKICAFELGDRTMGPDEQLRIREALRTEAERLRAVTVQVESSEPRPAVTQEASGD